MNNLKVNPIGIDSIIANLQNELYDKLVSVWGVDLEGYPRCYSINREGVVTIESYITEDDYDLGLVNTDVNKFFFIVTDDIKNGTRDYNTAKLELYFILNIADCYPGVTHRADEEVRADVLNILYSNPLIKVVNTSVHIDRVFGKYRYEQKYDMQPHHCFKIEMDVLPYKLNQVNCN